MNKLATKSFLLTMICIFIVVGISSCVNPDSSMPKDLSFGGITLGEDFPDSMKVSGKFKQRDGVLPSYDGFVKFKLPNSKLDSLEVEAFTSLDGDEVICITIGPFECARNIDEANDLYEMLKSKYSEFSDLLCIN